MKIYCIHLLGKMVCYGVYKILNAIMGLISCTMIMCVILPNVKACLKDLLHGNDLYMFCEPDVKQAINE